METQEIVLFVIFGSIAVFLIMREVLCWYFKINKRLSVLNDIKSELVQANRYTNGEKAHESDI
jgi:hypothetical protein